MPTTESLSPEIEKKLRRKIADYINDFRVNDMRKSGTTIRLFTQPSDICLVPIPRVENRKRVLALDPAYVSAIFFCTIAEDTNEIYTYPARYTVCDTAMKTVIKD